MQGSHACGFHRLPALMAAAALAFFGFAPNDAAQAQEMVDLELVLAVDVSRSMDYQEQLLQRDGYIAAFRSDEVIAAILGGGLGRIVVTYMEWAGDRTTRVIVPWSLIDSRESANAFASRLEEVKPERLSRTSISNALEHSQGLFGTSSWKGVRRVVDVSGDGPNNSGMPVEAMRDQLVNNGITINGLPLMIRTSTFGFGIENLDEYYTDCVIGGTGAFVIPVYDWESFPRAVRRKMVLEIARLAPRAIPASQTLRTTNVADRPKVDCLIGEKLWQQRMQDLEWR
ncbi:MAG: DUF1194 domain-containing protein [Salaquimonas sp.]|jgi:hypothetical protein|nr:DUF1194 domain-containing protein [Salaquimonas sp.]